MPRCPQDLVDEEQIVLLDIGFGSEAFATDQPYHLFAPAGQALRCPVGHIAERMYHLENALALEGRTRSCPCTTRDTVAVETPAARATS